jgi:uncharacterized protein YabN with tetrapyrrole methylase and pyrophosphatase domain
VVGTGIAVARQLTPEARSAYLEAQDAFFLASDPLAAAWLDGLRPDARSLHDLYEEGKPLQDTYAAMVEAILGPVRAGRFVCAAFYGHPGFFVRPAHEAIRQAHAGGHAATMLPGISSLDCLFCDLQLDPAAAGCQIYDAGDFVARGIVPEVSVPLVLLQISVVGQAAHAPEPDWAGLGTLVERLAAFYPGAHEVVVYEASPYVGVPAIVERAPLGELARVRLTPGMTLVVPPVASRS